ncbi:NitT/TauT family transport system permease protein [Stella humosa]|uniref:NitT/TauT family transport system permease protein n=1 Tax=Stella humosa TaxID=94 RepID=A0A3N1KY72_9PROT|nr:ABC transporter permease [Stella humosa]ROP84382.1 NitT/TauT family transport system permease protein [Stella humosa]BBK33898.1 ABC transporter permease [Stella humosa]
MTAPDTQPVPFRGGGFVRRRRRLVSVASLMGLILVWQAAVTTGLANPLFLPSPVAVGRALAELAASGALTQHLLASLGRVTAGWALGTVLGLAVGLAVGIFATARAAGMPLVSALFPIPKIAILPLFILWFGIGEPSKVATIAAGVFFPTVIAAAGGVDAVPRSLVRMGQSFGLPAWAIVLRIVLPGAMPTVLAGFRITVAIAVILVVAAEMIGADTGLGAFVLTAGNLMRTDQLLAGVVVLSALGLSAAGLVALAERLLLRWR